MVSLTCAAMPSFRHDGIEIAFLDEGKGEPVVLIHGFASNKEVNWVYPEWIETLTRAGRRAIALDNRGHGRSSKLYDPALYDIPLMAGDVLALMDHLKIARADLMGYSMGARILAEIAFTHPGRVRSGIVGGVGINMIEGSGRAPVVADALEAESLEAVSDQRGRAFRAFAEQTKGDLKALAACMRGAQKRLTREQLARLRVPVLVVTGTEDDIAGAGPPLAALIPNAEMLEIPGRNHMLAVGDKVFKAGALDFLARRP